MHAHHCGDNVVFFRIGWSGPRFFISITPINGPKRYLRTMPAPVFSSTLIPPRCVFVISVTMGKPYLATRLPFLLPPQSTTIRRSIAFEPDVRRLSQMLRRPSDPRFMLTKFLIPIAGAALLEGTRIVASFFLTADF
jgi:hypothetical protein